jgi:hypothetical protein
VDARPLLVPTLRVGMQTGVDGWEEVVIHARPHMHSHAERGNEKNSLQATSDSYLSSIRPLQVARMAAMFRAYPEAYDFVGETFRFRKGGVHPRPRHGGSMRPGAGGDKPRPYSRHWVSDRLLIS